jgi:hypothetical protein
MFWVLIATIAFTFIVSPLLVPRSKLKASLGDIQPPTATKGIPISVVFGTQKVSPNITWWGNVHADQIRTVTGNRTLLNPFASNHSQVSGYKYGADIAGGFCIGPVEELIDVQFEDVSIRKYDDTGGGSAPGFAGGILPPVGDGPLTIDFTASDLFGGDDTDGGVVGKLEFWFGKMTQNASATLAAKVGAAVSNYKGMCHFIWYNATFGTSPQIKAFYAVVRRCPRTVSPDDATANINGDANPADVIFEILTDRRWALGQSAAMIDMASFTAAAVTLKAENMGVSFTAASQDTGDALIGEVLRHADAVLFGHPLTGLLTLKLARADYDIVDLPRLNVSNVLKCTSYKRNVWPETYNEIKVNYIDRGVLPALTFLPDTKQAQDLASMQAMGQIASNTQDFNMFSNGDVALRTAFRSLRVMSAPLATANLVVNRSMHAVTMGSCIVWDWAPYGIQNMVFRVVTVKQGTIDVNTIELSLIEDVFATAPAVFTLPPGTQWTLPHTAPAAPLAASARPAPYWLVKSDSFVGINTVARGNKSSTTWDGYFDFPATSDAAPGLEYTQDDPFTPMGTLVSALRWNAPYQIEVADLTGNGLILNNYQDLEQVSGTTANGLITGERLAIIYGTPDDAPEIVAFRDFHPNGDGTFSLYGVLRGQFDTLPVDHPAGALVIFISPDNFGKYWPGFPGASAPTASGQTAANSGYKGWAASKGLNGQRAPEPPTFVISQTGKPLTDPRRAVMPYPPGKLTLNTVAANAIDTATPEPLNTMTLTWVGRNRLTEITTRLHSAAAVTPEGGASYELMILWVNRATGATIWTLRPPVVSVSPFAYTNDNLEVDLQAANGGVLPSLVDPNRTNGGLRFLVRSKVSATLFSEWVAIPGFKGTQSIGYPVVPSVVFLHVGTNAATLTDTADLQAWYSADNPANIVSGVSLTTAKDLTVFARDLNRSAGTLEVVPSVIHGLPAFDMLGGYMSNLTIPLKGGMTFFAVLNYTNLGFYHNCYDTVGTGSPPCVLWFADTNTLEANACSNPAQKINKSSLWGTLVVNNFNVAGKIGFAIRWNGVQIATESAAVSSGTIPGTPSVPASFGMTMFNRGGSSAMRGRIAEFGFYAVDKTGTEGVLETYLRAKYATW